MISNNPNDGMILHHPQPQVPVSTNSSTDGIMSSFGPFQRNFGFSSVRSPLIAQNHSYSYLHHLNSIACSLHSSNYSSSSSTAFTSTGLTAQPMNEDSHVYYDPNSICGIHNPMFSAVTDGAASSPFSSSTLSQFDYVKPSQLHNNFPSQQDEMQSPRHENMFTFSASLDKEDEDKGAIADQKISVINMLSPPQDYWTPDSHRSQMHGSAAPVSDVQNGRRNRRRKRKPGTSSATLDAVSLRNGTRPQPSTKGDDTAPRVHSSGISSPVSVLVVCFLLHQRRAAQFTFHLASRLY
jgi:hypothetical protein